MLTLAICYHCHVSSFCAPGNVQCLAMLWSNHSRNVFMRFIFMYQGCYIFRRENENKDKRILSLSAKVSATNNQLAKMDLRATKASEAVAQLTALNKQLTERNGQLVEKFSQEICKIGKLGTTSAAKDGQHLVYKSQVPFVIPPRIVSYLFLHVVYERQMALFCPVILEHVSLYQK